jgi:hypothetical protein
VAAFDVSRMIQQEHQQCINKRTLSKCHNFD